MEKQERGRLLKGIEFGVPPDLVRRGLRIRRLKTKDALQYFVKAAKEKGFSLPVTNEPPPDEFKNRYYWKIGGTYYTWLWNNHAEPINQIPIVHKRTGIFVGFLSISKKGEVIQIMVRDVIRIKFLQRFYNSWKYRWVRDENNKVIKLAQRNTSKEFSYHQAIFRFDKPYEWEMGLLLVGLLQFVQYENLRRIESLKKVRQREEFIRNKMELRNLRSEERSLRERKTKTWSRGPNGEDLFLVFDEDLDQWVDYRESKIKV